jgi:hypothetical protein
VTKEDIAHFGGTTQRQIDLSTGGWLGSEWLAKYVVAEKSARDRLMKIHQLLNGRLGGHVSLRLYTDILLLPRLIKAVLPQPASLPGQDQRARPLPPHSCPHSTPRAAVSTQSILRSTQRIDPRGGGSLRAGGAVLVAGVGGGKG